MATVFPAFHPRNPSTEDQSSKNTPEDDNMFTFEISGTVRELLDWNDFTKVHARFSPH